MNNLSIIPFYDSLDEQDFRKAWAYGEVFTLPVSCDVLVPFHFSVRTSADILSVVKIDVFRRCSEGVPFYDSGHFDESFSLDFNVFGGAGDTYWLNKFTAAGLHWSQRGAYYVFYFDANGDSLGLPAGQYYLKFYLSDGSIKYSDMFTCVPEATLSKYTRLEWENESNISYGSGIIPAGLTQWVYLDTDIGMPEYPFEEEGESRGGYFFPIKQISYKLYKFNFISPEYLCDALRIVRMSDEVTITDPLGRDYDVSSFTLNDPEWLEQGHYANVNCEFTTDTVIKVVGRSL